MCLSIFSLTLWHQPDISANSAKAPTPAPTPKPIDAPQEIKNLRIPNGDYAGGYLIAPAGRLQFYFANLGLNGIVPNLSATELDQYILPYLELYIRKLTPNYTIQDVVFTDGTFLNYTLQNPDSHDAYAGTFLTLAVSYVKARGNYNWFETNKATLKNIAYYNILLSAGGKTSGLVSVFQPGSNTNQTGYLMDNAEAYKGIRDFSAMLRSRKDIEADYYDSFATNIARGIGQLYDSQRRAFKSDDTVASASPIFYPGTTCQVFPQAMDIVEVSTNFTNAWNYLNSKTPRWEFNFDSNNNFPWAILGYVAAKRGDSAKARTQMQTIDKLFVNNRPMVTINELGYYQRTKNRLANIAN